MPAVYKDPRNALSNVVLKPAELADIETSCLVIEIHYLIHDLLGIHVLLNFEI